jgi:hypothetical protein
MVDIHTYVICIIAIEIGIQIHPTYTIAQPYNEFNHQQHSGGDRLRRLGGEDMKGRMKHKAPRLSATIVIAAMLLVGSLLTASAADSKPPHSSAALEKAKKAKISAVKFAGMPLTLVISTLHDESVRRDRQRKGVKISLGLNAKDLADAEVNLELKEVTLAEVLERVAEAVGLKLEASDTELLLVRKQAKQQSSLLSGRHEISLLGTWAAHNGIVKFAEDGTFESCFTNQTDVWAYEGRWLTRSNMLIVTTIKSNGVPSYSVTDCKILRADGSCLTYSVCGQAVKLVRTN